MSHLNLNTNVRHEHDLYSLEDRNPDAARHPSPRIKLLSPFFTSPITTSHVCSPALHRPAGRQARALGPRRIHSILRCSSDEDGVDRSDWVLSTDDEDGGVDEGWLVGEDWTLSLGLSGYWFHADGDKKEKKTAGRRRGRLQLPRTGIEARSPCSAWWTVCLCPVAVCSGHTGGIMDRAGPPCCDPRYITLPCAPSSSRSRSRRSSPSA